MTAHFKRYRYQYRLDHHQPSLKGSHLSPVNKAGWYGYLNGFKDAYSIARIRVAGMRLVYAQTF